MTHASHRRGLLLAVAAGLVALALLARAQDKGMWSDGGVMVRGSGKLATEQRQVGPFQAVHVKNSAKVVLRQAAREAVEVTADDNIVGLVETTVTERDGLPTLEIGSRRGASYTTSNPVVVTVDLVTLKALTISGAGAAVADNLKAGELKVRIQGSGDVQLHRLTVDALALSLAGSGDVAASASTVSR
jgi:hypothetical protein